MGKIKAIVDTGALRIGNTVATPLRIGGEGLNALANIPRQGISGLKNLAEVGKQTGNALLDNFLNFSKVDGKGYEKMIKVPFNVVSACTRRPFMIGAAGITSGLNQGIWQPFKKLLYTPGEMFKGMRKATRIFSKKKGFDFQEYDTHETKGDTRINQIKEKGIGFLGRGGSSKKSVEEKKPEDSKKEKKQEVKTEEKPNREKVDELKKTLKKSESKSETPASKEVATKPASIDEIKKNNKAESAEKDSKENAAKQWKNFNKEDKEKYLKDYTNLLENNLTTEGVIARGKKHNQGETIEEILSTLKNADNMQFATYIEDEILAKK